LSTILRTPAVRLIPFALGAVLTLGESATAQSAAFAAARRR
jgi:hypothetical protein